MGEGPSARRSPSVGLLGRLGRGIAHLAGFGDLGVLVTADVRFNFKWDLTASVLMGIAGGVIGNYMLVVARRLGADPLLLSVIIAGSFLGSVLAIAAPYLLETEQPAFRVALVLGVGHLVWILALFVGAPLPYTVVTVTHYLLVGLPGPMYARIVQGAYPRPVRGRLMAGVRTASSALALLTVPLAGVALDAVGYGATFAVAGIVGAVGSVAYARLRILRPSVSKKPSPWKLIVSALRNRTFRNYIIAYNVFGVSGLLIYLAMPIVLVDRFDLPFSIVGVLTLLQGLTGLLAFPLWGQIADRKSGPAASLWSNSVGVLVALLFLVSIPLGSVWVLALAFVARGVQIAGYEIGWQTSVTAMAAPEETSALTTTFLVVMGFRGLIVPFVGAALLSGLGPTGTFAVSLAIGLAGVLLMWNVARTFVPAPEEAESL